MLSNLMHSKTTYFYMFSLLLVTLVSVTALSGNHTSFNNDNKIYNISYHEEGTLAKNKST